MTLAPVGLVAVLALQTLTWMLSVRRRDASLADVGWGVGFVLLAWIVLFASPRQTPRAWFAAALDGKPGQCPKVNTKPSQADYFALLPEAPSIGEVVPGFEMSSWSGVFGPANGTIRTSEQFASGDCVPSHKEVAG